MIEVEKEVFPTRPQCEILQSESQVNCFIAGQGSGKTACAGFVTGNLITEYPNQHGFIGANTYSQLTNSTLFRIRSVWQEFYGWSEYKSKENPGGNYVIDVNPPAHFNTKGHQYDSYYNKICFENGTVIYKGSLDNYKAHDGLEFSWAVLDETKDTKEEAVKEVILGRLREQGMVRDGQPWCPLFIFTSPAKVQWLNDWFGLDAFATEIKEVIYDEDNFFYKVIENKKIVISSAFHNSKNLPSNFLQNQKKNMNSALQDSLIYGNPFSQTGGEFYKFFTRQKHVRPCVWDEAEPIHLTFDFNVNPYMTGCVHQIRNNKRAEQIDEICLENPLNTTTAVCREFKRRFPVGRVQGLFIYGDPAGMHEDTRIEKRSEEGYNDFTIIEKELAEYYPEMRITDAAPPVKPRGDFLNTIFEKMGGPPEELLQGLEIYIDPKCTKTITDYIYLKQDNNGRKLKEKGKNEATGVESEKYGHTSDADDYFHLYVFRNEFVFWQRGTAIINVKGGRSIPAKRRTF